MATRCVDCGHSLDAHDMLAGCQAVTPFEEGHERCVCLRFTTVPSTPPAASPGETVPTLYQTRDIPPGPLP